MYLFQIDMVFRSWLVGLLFFALLVTGERKRIVSGAVWNDDAGNRIQAHGGCLIQVSEDEHHWSLNSQKKKTDPLTMIS